MNRISRYAEGVMEACWLIALIVSPLFFNVYSSRVFEPDKIALVRSLAVVALTAWLIKLISEGGPRFEHITREQFRLTNWRHVPFFIPVAALTIIYVISTLLSVAPNISIWGSYQRMQGFYSTIAYIILFTVLAANLRRRAQIERILTVVAVTSLPMATYGILQRYKLDPLPWGGDTIERVTGHAGNAIFLGAYLIMASMIVLSRVVTAFRAVMTGTGSLVLPTLRAAIYIFIFALNLVAIWFTQSRGPQLGLLAGLFFFFVLMALHYRVRWLVLTTVGLGLAAGAFLVVLNLPNTPLASLAQTRGFDRLARVFDEIQGRTGTGQVRVLIWTGVVQMMTPHEPLEYPDGSTDIWNPIRPLVGYGPEAMLIAYNRFYPPDLGKLEARNASPDRSHNETFDALAFTGVLGLLAQFGLFVSLFYYSLKWLGLINSAMRRNIFLLLVLGGGVVSTIIFVQWQGPQFFGVSLPFGMILGLIAFLAIYAVIPDHGDAPKLDSWRAIAMVGLFAAIVAHFVEIHFGIAIVSTRTHFWVFLGALLVLGWVWPRAFAAEAPAPEPKPAPPPVSAGKSFQRGGSRRRSVTTEAGNRGVLSRHVYITISLLLMIFLTLGYNFITNGTRETSALAALWNSLTMRPGAGDSLAVLGLMLLTWLMGGALFYLEEAPETVNREWVQGFLASLGFVLLGSISMWVILASLLVTAGTQPRSVDDLTRLVGLLNAYYFFALAVLLLAAWQLQVGSGAGRPRPGESALVWLGYLGLPLVALVVSVFTNLQTIQADIIYKTGQQVDDSGQQPAVAIELFNRTLALAPSQDFYYLFLGRAYLNASNTVAPEQRDQLFQTAEQELLRARQINPLNTDHSANLARLNRQWAILSGTPEAVAERATKSDQFYVQATTLSPNNVGLWNEWALVKFQLLSDGVGALEKLNHSVELDDTFDQTYQYLGDYYAWEAARQTDEAARQPLYAKAIAAYQQGVERAQTRATSLLGIRIGLAQVYQNTLQIPLAIQEYLKVAELNAGASQWQVFRVLGVLFQQSGDNAQARNYLQQAIALAPEAEKANLEALLATVP